MGSQAASIQLIQRAVMDDNGEPLGVVERDQEIGSGGGNIDGDRDGDGVLMETLTETMDMDQPTMSNWWKVVEIILEAF